MREIIDAVRVEASPERVWSWLTELADHYTQWHPDHVSAEWLKGRPNDVGSILRVVELLDGRREELSFELAEVDPPLRMGYRILGPHALLLPGGAFTVSPADGGSMFAASIQYRFGAITERVFRRRLTVLGAHMREEGVNLKRMVEARP